jgi:hypothetical protein
MTVMTYSNNSGTRRCDDRCHSSRGRKCTCICGGLNHGVGTHLAGFHTAQALEELEARECERHHTELLERDFDAGQKWLFGEAG